MSKTKMIITDVIVGILLAALVVGNSLAMTFKDLITIYLGQDNYEAVSADSADIDNIYYKSEFSTAAALVEAQRNFSMDLQAEATVLLKNANETLPLATGSKITLLGAGTAMDQFIAGGIGSGAIDTSSIKPLSDCFKDAGYEVNQAMVDFYAVGGGSTYRRSAAKGTISECPVSAFTQTELDSIAEYGDAAVIVFGRVSGEGTDIPKSTTDDPEKSFLQLSKEEVELVQFATENFDKTVVLLNTTMAMEVDDIADLDIAIAYIGAGGMAGHEAIPEILNGVRFPSGRLTDTYVKNSMQNPSSPNYDVFQFVPPSGADTTFTDTSYVLYEEGIYVGYRYYETRYEDKVLGTPNTGDYNYDDVVMYPFGYGLGYTTFAWTEFGQEENEDSFEFAVTVTNNGSYSGKDVVEIYMQSPYTEYDKENGIEKASVVLAGFAKTDELAPGASQKVTLTVPKQYMRSYDAKNAHTYIVDDGEYFFTAATDSHSAVNNVLTAKGYSTADGMTGDGNADMVFTYLQETFDAETYSYGENGEKIENQFDNIDLQYYMEDVTYLSRSDWEGTWPSYGIDHPTLTATEAMLEDYAVKHAVDEAAVLPVTGADNGLTLASMIGVEKDNEMWDQLLDEVTADEMMHLVENGGYYTNLIESIGKPKTLDKDGPSGITSTLIGGAGCFGFPIEMLVACSWNTDMAERLGELVGEDSLMARVAGWYAPGLNTHRSPFNGRNYEYYSEDPILGTKMGTAVVEGAQSRGAYAYIKHFAMDDQGLGGAYTFANEQSIREIYLRQFEETVTIGDAHAAMTNNGIIGMTWCGRNKGLITNVLRGEWGFDGFVITDQATANRSEKLDIYDGLAAGTDLWLNSAAGTWVYEGYAENPTFLSMLRNATKNILYTVANSNAMNGISAQTVVARTSAPWEKWLIALDVVVGGILVIILAYAFISYMKKNVLIYKDVDNTSDKREEEKS